MSDRSTWTEFLTDLAFKEMMEFFRTGTNGHEPYALMLEGLYNLQDTLTKMLTGGLEAKVYVSSLDPGVGKTSAIKAFLKVYLPRMSQYGDQGVILCFDRLEEIEKFHEGNPLPLSSFGVYVSENTDEGRRLNRMGVGHENISNAPILFTTKQQIIKKSLQTKSFVAIDLFHYKGLPRTVRIWDESAIIGRPLTTTIGHILELYRTLESAHEPLLADQLLELWDIMKNFTDKTTIDFPDFGGLDFVHGFKWEGATTKKTAETLMLLSGRVVTVRVEGSGRVVLDCVESIPKDFLPFLVTDASARIRETYNLLNHYHQNVIYLEPRHSVKRYDPLTVYVWDRSSSRDYYNRNGVEQTAQEIAKVVQSRLDEPFLIVTMKGDNDVIKKKWIKSIKSYLPPADHSRLHFLTWGKHTANNAYAYIPNVILTSQLHYSPSDYEAIGRASADLPSSKGSLTEGQLKNFRKGEIAHHLLQCICRGAVRIAKGDSCPPSRCWIIASKGTGVERLIPDIFPGCQVMAWKTKEVKVKGIHQRALEYIIQEFSTGVDRVYGSAVRKFMEVKNKSNFARDYISNQRFKDLCTSSGLILLIDDRNGRPYFEMNPFAQA